MKYTVTVEIDIETNDQPPSDVRARLAHVRNRVGTWIGEGAKDGAQRAIWVFSPESYFPGWPPNGKGAEVVAVRQRTRRAT